jgi:DNA-binding CsgD family transcriptional regulator
VRELAAALVADGVEPNAGSRALLEATGPQTIARATLGRLARLSDHAAAMAQAIAILGRDATLARAARLAELDDDQALGALDILVAADFVGASEPIEFRHPIVRAAIYNELAPGTRTLAHRRVAEMLAGEGADINATASHLLLSQPIGSAETVAVLRRAATHALGLGAPASAATYLARAIEEAGARELRATLLLELGLAEKLAGDVGSALEHLEQVRTVASDPVMRTRAAIEASMIRVFSGDWHGPLAVIEQALLELGDRDPDLAPATEASLTAMMGYDVRLVSTLDSRLPALRKLADGSGSAARSLLMTLAGIGAMRGEPSDLIRTRVERAWDGGRFLTGGGIVELLPQGCYALLMYDDLDGAQQLVDGLRVDAQARGSLMEFVMASTMASALETRRGNLSIAEAEMRVACDRVMEHGFLFALPTLLWGGVDVLVERPEAASVAALIEILDPAAMPNSFNVAVVSLVRGRLRFVAGDQEAAIADLRTTGEIMETLHVSNPNAVSWRSTLALMLTKAERDEAIDLVGSELAEARAIAQPRAIGVALRTLGMLVGSEDGLAHLKDAVSVLAGSPARLEHARALVEFGAALRRGGSRAAAREPLREGLELAARCGATRLQDHARQELSATGAKPRRLYQTSRDALTPSELRVASLAAEGRTNKEIAQLLFVTNKTIEAHLQHSYAKLGINSRKQLKEVLTSQTE